MSIWNIISKFCYNASSLRHFLIGNMFKMCFSLKSLSNIILDLLKSKNLLDYNFPFIKSQLNNFYGFLKPRLSLHCKDFKHHKFTNPYSLTVAAISAICWFSFYLSWHVPLWKWFQEVNIQQNVICWKTKL